MIPSKNAREIELIRGSCRIVVEVQRALEQVVAPGVSTEELDALAEKTIRQHGAIPAFKGYHGFPASICASINSETVHGVPGARRLSDKDVLSIDVGVQKDGFFGDSAFTLGVGSVQPAHEILIDATRRCLQAGIAAARSGNRVSDISHAIEKQADADGLKPIREFGGHGIGRALHEDPSILNHGKPGQGPLLRPGLVVAIEPIMVLGEPELETGADGWTEVTCSGDYTAHFEHTVVITEDGPEILTAQTARSEPILRN